MKPLTVFRLPTPGGPLHALMTCPDSAPRFRALLFPPFLEARKSTARMLLATARRMAAAGGAAIIVDPRGCGYSPGHLQSVTPDDWLDDWRAAEAWCRQTFPGLPSVWLGVRFSATLCLTAAGQRYPGQAAGRPDLMVLWAPLASGADAFRHWTQRRSVNRMLTGRKIEPLPQVRNRLERGETIDYDGFAITPGFAQHLLAIDPAMGGKTLQAALRSLALMTMPDPSLNARLKTLAPSIEIAVHRMPPFWNAVGLMDPEPFVAPTLDWLQTAVPPGRLSPTSRFRLPAAAEPTAPGIPFPVTLGPTDNGLRGIYHPPAPNRKMRGRLLMLHGWAGCRLGPQRLFVRAAEAFAQAGYGCFRFDFRGRGESDGETAAASMQTMAQDAAEALAWLRSTAGPDDPHVILLGICSGCKVAMITAAGDRNVDTLALWSAEPMGCLRNAGTNRRKTRFALFAYARKLCRTETWRKLVRGAVQFDMVGKALLQHETRNTVEARIENDALARLPGRTLRLLFVHGGGDPETARAAPAYERFCADSGLAARTTCIAGANHNFSGREWEAQLTDLTLAFFNGETRHHGTD